MKGTARGAVREWDAAGAPIYRNGSQHIDTPKTVARLKSLNVNTYLYLVSASSDWADLTDEFMPAIQQTSIKVMVYLLPPKECADKSTSANPGSCDLYVPHAKDYLAWGRAIATLSKQHPNLVAWTVDDMDNDAALFTPSYVRSMNVEASTIQPSLDFYMQVYRAPIIQSFVDNYAYAIDGLIMPFRDDPHRNTTWAGSLQGQIDEVSALLASRGKRLIVMLYGNRLSDTVVQPDADYINNMVDVALANSGSGKKIAGVIIWNLELDPLGMPSGARRCSYACDSLPATNMALTGNGVLSLSVNSKTVTQAGQYAQASTTLRLNSGSTSCTMVLRHNDNRSVQAELGYHEKQVYVGGSLVWARDVATDGTTWEWSSALNITSKLSNGSATLVLRLAELKGVWSYQVNAVFDDIAFTGCNIANAGFEDDSTWQLSRSGGPILPSIYQFSSTYTTDVFNSVATRFAGA